MESALSFYCPHCNLEYFDELELLGADIAHDFLCADCRRPFVLYLLTCDCCGAEEVQVHLAYDPALVKVRADCRCCRKSNFASAVEEEEL